MNQGPADTAMEVGQDICRVGAQLARNLYSLTAGHHESRNVGHNSQERTGPCL
jgi:hypothetical protein